jgi:FkbM family methyltransferase
MSQAGSRVLRTKRRLKETVLRALHRRLNVSFSKAGDDIQLKKLLPRAPGTYVDIGCWHPVRASNTYYFHLRGWKGICVDPNPELRVPFEAARPGDTLITAGVAPTAGSMEYFMLRDPHSSMNTLSRQFLEDQGLMVHVKQTMAVPTVPLADLLERYIGPDDRLDFFDVDVEGYDLAVLQTNDWERFRPKIVVVESHDPLASDVQSETARYLADVGYGLAGKSVILGDLGNLFFVRR